jgi:hypothetical protein
VADPGSICRPAMAGAPGYHWLGLADSVRIVGKWTRLGWQLCGSDSQHIGSTNWAGQTQQQALPPIRYMAGTQ